MPNRIIREGILTSSKINALSLGAENFYRRLLSVVDDYGRYHGAVVTLRGACWPTKPEKISQKDVSKWLTELLKGDEPLVKTYCIKGDTYIEVQNFGQATRSKSKFPAPPWYPSADNLRADCTQPDSNPTADRPQNASTMRYSNFDIRNSNTNAEPNAPLVAVALPEWKHDELFLEFKLVYEKSGGAFIEDDWHKAYQFVWKTLDWEQKAHRMNAVKSRVWGDPRYIHKPETFLRSEWKRSPPKPQKTAADEAKEVGDDIKRRVAEYEQRRVQPRG